MRGLLTRFRSLLAPKGSLTRMSITGGVWMGLTNVIGRGTQLLMVVILANLLTPTAFGVAGVALLAASALNRFSQLGIDAALIQNADDDVDRYLNTTWVLNGARGLVLAGVLLAASPVVAELFGMPLVAAILPVMAIGPAIKGFQNPAMVYFTKDLQYHKRFAYQVSAAVAQFLVAVGYALYDPTVWAFAYGFITTSVVQAIASYALHDYRPWPSFEIPLAKELIGYGKWMTGASIIGFLRSEGDDVLVGYLLAPAALGFYQMGYRLSNAAATEVTHVVADVTFPAYSKVQDDLGALRTGLERSIQVSMLAAAPLALGLLAITPTFVRGFLGQEWMEMVVPMQILALYGLVHAFTASFGSVWKALGRPDILTKIQILSVVALIVAVVPLTMEFGIVGTSASVLGVYVLVSLPLDTWVTVKLTEMSVIRMYKPAIYPTVAATAMAAVVWVVQERLVLQSAILEVAILVVVGAVAYVLAVAVLETQFNWGLRAEFREVRRAI